MAVNFQLGWSTDRHERHGLLVFLSTVEYLSGRQGNVEWAVDFVGTRTQKKSERVNSRSDQKYGSP